MLISFLLLNFSNFLICSGRNIQYLITIMAITCLSFNKYLLFLYRLKNRKCLLTFYRHVRVARRFYQMRNKIFLCKNDLISFKILLFFFIRNFRLCTVCFSNLVSSFLSTNCILLHCFTLLRVLSYPICLFLLFHFFISFLTSSSF